MTRNDDDDRPDNPPATMGHEATTSQADSSPTFPSEAVSLLRHLKMGVSRPDTPISPPGEFPRIPNYEIECELGKGGMGVVYKARHIGLNRTVAIKMILAHAHALPGEVVRFVAEAEAVAAVKHPNVVQVYDLGEFNGCPYFVMELVEGGNLAARLQSGGPLDPTAAAGLIVAVARGVQAAHDAGIVHRDLKPANILLAVVSGQESGVSSEKNKQAPSSQPPAPCPQSLALPKVSDFGLAKRLASDLTRSQAVLGTPAYMAPEQAGGKAKFVGPQADVYALGVILYECLTGKPPFNGADPWSLIRQVMEDTPEAPSKRAPGVPRDLELICLKCLEKEPHHRYPTAAALADDLTRFLAGEPVSVRPLGTATRTLRWAKKNPSSAGQVVAGALLLLIAPPLLVWVQSRLEQRAAVAEEAGLKQAEAEKARIAAEQLAEARELFGIQNKLRNWATTRPPEWTVATRAELPRALALAGDDPRVLEDLRSAAAGALLTPDLFLLEPAAKAFSGAAMATDPKTGLVAVGEFKAWGDCRVLFINPATGETVRQLAFPTTAVTGKGPLDLAQDGTRSLAFSRDGKRLFVGTRSSQVMRFDLESPTDKPAASWKASSHSVEQLAVSPDGTTVYGLCRPEDSVFAWTADTGKPLVPFAPDEKPAPFRTFDVLPSGDLIACNGVRLYWWKADYKVVAIVPNPGGFRLAAAGSSAFLIADDARMKMHDRDSLAPANQFADPNLRMATHEENVRTIVVHPSGAFVATAAGETDRTVKVWELASGRLVGAVIAPGSGPVAVAWSGDGANLLATAEGFVSRWRFAPADAQRFACFAGWPLESATFTADNQIAALGETLNGRSELLVGAAGGPAVSVHVGSQGPRGQVSIAVDPTGGFAVATKTPGIRSWKSGAAIPGPAFTRQDTWSPRFSPDGGTLWAVVDSKTVRTYDPVTKAERARWNNSISEVMTGLAGVNALAVGRDVAVAGGRDGAVYLLNPACEVTAALRGSGDPVLAVAVTPDGSLAAAGTQTGKLRVIRVADRTEVAVAAHPGGVTAVAVSRDGALLATGGRDRVVRLWKRAGERFEPVLQVANLPGGVRELSFSPTDGRLLVLLANEHAARVWELDRLNAQLAELKLGW